MRQWSNPRASRQIRAMPTEAGGRCLRSRLADRASAQAGTIRVTTASLPETRTKHERRATGEVCAPQAQAQVSEEASVLIEDARQRQEKGDMSSDVGGAF